MNLSRRRALRAAAAVGVIVGSNSLLSDQAGAWAYNGANCQFYGSSIDYTNSASGTDQAATASGAASDWSSLTDVTMAAGGTDLYLSTSNLGSTGYDGTNYWPTCLGAPAHGVWCCAVTIASNTYYTAGYDYGGKKQLWSHEIGHALGLGHAGSNSIMYPDSNRYFVYGHAGPQSDDINGVNAQY